MIGNDNAINHYKDATVNAHILHSIIWLPIRLIFLGNKSTVSSTNTLKCNYENRKKTK